MTRRLAQFAVDITRARDLVGLGQGYVAITHGVVDSSDIYRAALVQAVAALDHYFHGVILDRAVDLLLGRLSVGPVTKLGISFSAVQEILSASDAVEREQRIRTHVAQRLALETFQRAESIGTGLASVAVGKIWATAFAAAPAVTMTSLNLIVDRRNKIVHQGDSDPLVPGAPTPLSDADAVLAVATVDSIVRTIDPFC